MVSGKVCEKKKKIPARRVPRRLKAMHFMTPCSKYSSITSGKSPCSGSLHKKHIYTKNYYNFKTKFQAKIKNILEREREWGLTDYGCVHGVDYCFSEPGVLILGV